MGLFSCKFLLNGECRFQKDCKVPRTCCVYCASMQECSEKKSLCPVLELPFHMGHYNPCGNYDEGRCWGGNYCDFPAGKKARCCRDCELVFKCPDEDGICSQLLPPDPNEEHPEESR